MKRVFLLIVTFTSLIYSNIYAANWVDNWLSSAIVTGTGPSAYEIGTRNYLSAGYGSLRWDTKAINPISFTPPTLRFGCGGVDIFLGSIGLLDFDYMVDRLKNIMYSTGAFAFQYALTEMCSLCRQILDTLDASSNFLNSLQLDECKAGKAVAMKLLSPLDANAAKEASILLTKEELFGGAVESWHEFVKKIKGEASPNETRQMNSTEQQKLSSECGTSGFYADLIDSSKGNGSVLNYIAYLKSIPNEWIEVVRGLAGDVYIDIDTTSNKSLGIDFIYNPYCKKYDNVVQAFIEGKVQKQTFSRVGTTVNFTCIDETEGTSIVDYAKNSITDLMNAMISKTSPATSTESFLKITGASFFKEIRMAYEVGFDSSFFTDQNLLVECASYTFAASLLRNILAEVEKLQYDMEKKYEHLCKHILNPSKCAMCSNVAQNNFERAMKKLIKNLEKASGEVYKIYVEKVLSGDSPCQAWKRAQKTLVELNNLLRSGSFASNLVMFR